MFKKLIQYIPDMITWFMLPIIVVCGIEIGNQIINSYKTLQNPPNTKYIGYATGTVEAIHIGGRREVVTIEKAQLEFYPNQKGNLGKWVLTGDIVQPDGRKNYFMPGVSGNITLENGLTEWQPNENILVIIWMQSGKPVRVNYREYKEDKLFVEFDAYFGNIVEYRVFQSWYGD